MTMALMLRTLTELPSSPLAQPRNLIVGNSLAAVIGISYWYIFHAIGGYMWIGAALAVATSIAAMHVTKSLHPPAGKSCSFAFIYLRN